MKQTVAMQHILAYGLVVIVSSVVARSRDMKDVCKMCKSMTDSFDEKLKATAKSNFGGGNTRWEEKSLGSYAFSETRLLEITETLCEKTSDEKKCHSMLESNEELLEYYWFNVFKKDPETSKLYDWLCMRYKKVDSLKGGSLYEPSCCKPGTFGDECLDCQGGSDKPCSGHGTCDGDATRGGTGKCLCNTGYHGDTCEHCSEGYYGETDAEDKDAIKECKSCHISCKTCTGGDPSQCLDCRVGYKNNPSNETTPCEDVDECAEKSICTSGKYCSNTVGSYVCMACDPACDQCLGGGNDKCVKCKKGYQMEDNKCIDVDECKPGTLCQAEHMYCQNTKGSYKCQCRGHYEVVGDKCLRKPPSSFADPASAPKRKKRNGVSSDEMFKNVSPYNMPTYFAIIGLFAATGHFLRGHLVGSILLISAMSLTIYRIASNFG